MTTAAAATGPFSFSAWSRDIRATATLAWPLILTNVAQVALATTDVIMMGWLGPDALAAGALAVNLNFAFLIFAIGLVTATSPLVAIELGRRRHSVRDVRRTVRQGFWAAVTIAVPGLGDPVAGGADTARPPSSSRALPTPPQATCTPSSGGSCRS